MADYYSILKKTISGLSSNSPEIRSAVYAKARTAIERQLRAMNPPPDEAAIARQLELLEEASARIETESVSKPEIPEAAKVPAEPVNPAPAVAEPVESTAERSAGEGGLKSSPVVPEKPVTGGTTDRETPEPPKTTEIPDSVPVATGASEPGTSARNAGVAPVEAIPEAPATVTAIPGDNIDDPAVSNAAGTAPASPVQTEMPPPPVVESLDPSPAETYSRPLESEFPGRKSGGFGKAILVLLFLALLGGGGYALWLNKGELTKAVSGLFGGSEEAVVAQSDDDGSEETGESGNAAGEKEAVRIGADGEDEPADPLEGEPDTEEEPEAPLVLEEQAVTGEEQTEPIVEPAVEEAGEQSAVEPSATPAAIPVGEVAYLYEEGSAGANATRSNAGIAWATRMESPEPGLPEEPVIVGEMEIPEKGISLDLTIKRNVDEALSASHLIELKFTTPENFSGGSIESISRFVMKLTEEARGEPLVAVPVKVSDGYFLIALDNLQQAVEVNSKLLLEAAWIDIPVSYTTEKRALVTLEKGTSGNAAFRKAFSDWQNR